MYFPIGNGLFCRSFSAKKRELEKSKEQPRRATINDEALALSLLHRNQSLSQLKINTAALLHRPIYKSGKSASSYSGGRDTKEVRKSSRKHTLRPAKIEKAAPNSKPLVFPDKMYGSSRQLKKVSRLRLRQPASDKLLDRSANFEETAINQESEKAAMLAKRYIVESELGRGSYGAVYKCKDTVTSEFVAVKQFLRGKLQEEKFEARLIKQVEIMSNLTHRYIASFRRYIRWEGRHFMVMKYCEGPTLKQFVKQKTKLSQKQAGTIFGCIIEAIGYCHQKKVAHRDIKLENIIVCDGGQSVKLIDFGFSVVVCYKGEKLRSFCGTPLYMAPQITARVPYEPTPTDVWALGIVLFYMLTGKHPFIAKDEIMLFHSIQKSEPILPKEFSTSLRQLLKELLQKSCQNRPTLSVLPQLNWLRQLPEKIQ